MPYISSVEQIGIQQGHREVILSILKSRFGDLDENLTKTMPPKDDMALVTSCGEFCIYLVRLRDRVHSKGWHWP